MSERIFKIGFTALLLVACLAIAANAGNQTQPTGIRSVSCSSGINCGTSGGTVTATADTSVVQHRFTGACSAGNAVQGVDSAGNPTCIGIGTGTVTSVGCGTGLTGGTFTTSGTCAVDNTLFQARISTACGAGQAIQSVSSGGTPTCISTGGGATPNAYSGTHFEWNDDWLYRLSTTNGNQLGPWLCSQSGTSAACTATDGLAVATRPGVQSSAAGTTTTGKAALMLSSSTVDFGAGNWTWQDVWGVPSLSSATDEYQIVDGFFDTPSAINPVDGCWVLYDRGNVATGGPNTSNTANLSCWCSTASVATTFIMDGVAVSDSSFTTVAAPVAAVTWPSTNVEDIKIVVTGTTEADFFVNGVKSCVIRNHIPSGAANLTGAGRLISKSAGTTSRTVGFDYTNWAVDLTSARTP